MKPVWVESKEGSVRGCNGKKTEKVIEYEPRQSFLCVTRALEERVAGRAAQHTQVQVRGAWRPGSSVNKIQLPL